MDLALIIKTLGYIGIFAIIFSESGLLFGFFFPGDSLLFTAGFLATQGYFSIAMLIALSFLGAVLGDSFGYWFGKKVGPRLFRREDSLIFNKKHIRRAEKFYRDHGTKTVILARFVPVVRTFAPIMAGVASMPYATFLSYNLIGGVLWGAGMPALGYYLGNAIPDIDRYIIPIIAIIVALSVLPPAVHWLLERRRRTSKEHR